MKFLGSTPAGRATGMIFFALASSAVWALIAGALAISLLSISRPNAQMIAVFAFIALFVCFIPTIRRVASENHP